MSILGSTMKAAPTMSAQCDPRRSRSLLAGVAGVILGRFIALFKSLLFSESGTLLTTEVIPKGPKSAFPTVLGVHYRQRSLEGGHIKIACYPINWAMAELLNTVVGFLAALVVSTLVIYLVTKMTGEKEGLMTALIAAIVGTVIYTVIYFILGDGLLAAALGGVVWLLALKSLYRIGWLKALLIAVLVWILTSIIGWILPSLALTGPL